MELKCSNNETVLRSFDCGKNKLGHVGLTVTNKRVIATTKGSANLIKKEIPLESVKAVNFSCATDALSGTQIFLGLICIILMLGSMFACVGDLLGVNINLIKSDDIAMRILFALLAIAFLIFAILLFKRRNSICLNITQKIKNGGRQRTKALGKVYRGPGLIGLIVITMFMGAIIYLVTAVINNGKASIGILLVCLVGLILPVFVIWPLSGAKDRHAAKSQEELDVANEKSVKWSKRTLVFFGLIVLAYTIVDVVRTTNEGLTITDAIIGDPFNVISLLFVLFAFFFAISPIKHKGKKAMVGATTSKVFKLNLSIANARLLASEIGAAILDARFVAEEQSKAQEQSQEENKTE